MRPDRAFARTRIHEDPPGLFGRRGPPCSIVWRGSSRGPVRFAPLDPFWSGRCYSLASASADLLLAHPLSPSLNVVLPGAAPSCSRGDALQRPGCWPYARPLFISALVWPSRESFRRLTAPCHLPAPAHRLLSDRQLFPRAPLWRDRGSFHRETRIVPPSPRLEEASPRNEKMEERLEPPSVVSNRLPASADLRGLSATQTRRLAAPDRPERVCLPCDVPAFRPRTVSLGHRFCRCLCDREPRLAPWIPAAPRGSPLLLGISCRPPRQRIDGLRWASSSSFRPALRQCVEDQHRYVSINFCFPLLHHEYSRSSCTQYLFET
jgi:hypothetical protein